MTVFFADEPIEPKSIVACPECGFEFSFNHSEGWSNEEEGYRFVCYRCRAEQAEAEAAALRERVRRLERAADRLLELLYHGHATLTEDADAAAQELRVVLGAGDGR